jgi:peptidoglycan/LPS O-acetylase OafA/YrhL
LGTSFWVLIFGPVLSIGAATLTYRLVEQPGIRLGKFFTEAMITSSGPWAHEKS